MWVDGLHPPDGDFGVFMRSRTGSLSLYRPGGLSFKPQVALLTLASFWHVQKMAIKKFEFE